MKLIYYLLIAVFIISSPMFLHAEEEAVAADGSRLRLLIQFLIPWQVATLGPQQPLKPVKGPPRSLHGPQGNIEIRIKMQEIEGALAGIEKGLRNT